MGTEIVVTTIAHLLLLTYSVSIRVAHYVFRRHRVNGIEFGMLYKILSLVILLLSLFIPAAWLFAISDTYEFSVGYMVFINLPIIILCILALMPIAEYKNIISCLR